MTRGVTLIVIAKSPQPGRVKTRLCPPCTPTEAAALAAEALTDTLETVAAVGARRHLIALDGPVGPWLPRTFDVVPQVGAGLGERLSNAFAHCRGPAFLVGMDTPQLRADQIAAAVGLLSDRDADAVLGPAVDGGWWGIGFRRPTARAFLDVEMSTEHTHAQQLERLHSLGLRTRALPVLRDVDTFHDAIAVSELAPDTRFARAVEQLAPRLQARADAR